MKRIYLLGATGSIGTQTLEIIRANKDEYRLVSMVVGDNITLARQIITEFRPEFVSVKTKANMYLLEEEFTEIQFSYGNDGIIKAIQYGTAGGILINALVGFIGLMPTIEAIKMKRDVLIANKETIVTAGDIVLKLAKENKVKIIPVDSEHSAILQCLNGETKKTINKLIITASGGSFYNKTRSELIDIKKEDALKHPNWKMGHKITIDCATMVNKGLEVIEAHHLFGIPYDKIETIIHPESIVHSMVEFIDKSVIVQLGCHDMRIPIQYALTYPKRMINKISNSLDLKTIGSLTFKEMDFNRFPCLEMAYMVGKLGGIMPTVYNASNEIAVELFLNDQISFLDIEKIIKNSINHFKNISNPTISDIINTDSEVRQYVSNSFGGKNESRKNS